MLLVSFASPFVFTFKKIDTGKNTTVSPQSSPQAKLWSFVGLGQTKMPLRRPVISYSGLALPMNIVKGFLVPRDKRRVALLSHHRG